MGNFIKMCGEERILNTSYLESKNVEGTKLQNLKKNGQMECNDTRCENNF